MGSEFLFKNILSIIPEVKPTSEIFPHVPVIGGYCENAFTLDFGAKIREIGIRATQAYIKEFVREKKIDLLIVTLQGDSFQFPIEFFHELRSLTNLVFWQYDDECFFEVLSKHYAQAAQAVVATGYFQVYAYRGLSIPTVAHHAMVTKGVFPPISVPRDIDVSFVGDCTKNDRMEYIQFLRDNGIRVETFGTGSKNGYLDLPAVHKIYIRTKINLNFTKLGVLEWINKDDPMVNNLRQLKARPAQSAATRSFCLSEYEPSLPHAFKLGHEMECFYDKASLLEKVKYYLSHDREREAIAENAYRRAMRDYEDEVWMPRILGELKIILAPEFSSEKPVPTRHTSYKSPRFMVRQINALFVVGVSALRRGQFRVASEIAYDLFQHGPLMFLRGSWSGLWRAVSLYINRFLPGPEKI